MNLQQFKSKLDSLVNKYHSTDENDEDELESVLDQTLELLQSFKPANDRDRDTALKLALDMVDYAGEDTIEDLMMESKPSKTFKKFVSEVVVPAPKYPQGSREWWNSLSKEEKVEAIKNMVPETRWKNNVVKAVEKYKNDPPKYDDNFVFQTAIDHMWRTARDKG